MIESIRRTRDLVNNHVELMMWLNKDTAIGWMDEIEQEVAEYAAKLRVKEEDE